MSDLPYIELEDQTPKNRFPIVLQLSILGVIMLVMFSSLFFSRDKVEQTLSQTETIQPAGSPATVPIAVPQKIEGVSVRATSAYVWDIEGQRALFTKNSNEVLPLASITKLMTALLAHELIADETPATVSLRAIKQEGASGLSAGEQLEAEKLRELALVSSSNDAAFALAASVGELLGERDPVYQFIAGMNIRADELGLETLEFKNTTGLDVSESEPGAVGSAKDVSFLMEYIVRNYPELLEPTQQTATRIYNTAGAYHDINNTNEVALEIPNMIGSKTGYTDLAGGNLTIAFDVAYNRPIVITVLGSTRDERFSDVLRLVQAVQESMGEIDSQ